MRSISDRGPHQMVKFVVKNLGYVMVVNSVVLAVLWILRDLHLFTPILMYEVVFISGLGVLQILASHIYKGDGLSYRWGKYRAYYLDLRKFAKLKPEERSRYRREGKVRITIGLTLLIGAIILHFSMI